MTARRRGNPRLVKGSRGFIEENMTFRDDFLLERLGGETRMSGVQVPPAPLIIDKKF